MLHIEDRIAYVKERIVFYNTSAERMIQLSAAFQALYFASISFSDIKKIQAHYTLPLWIVVLFIAPVFLFLVTLGISTWILMLTPKRPAETKGETDEHRLQKELEELEKVKNKRHRLMVFVYGILGLAFIFLLVVLVIYLAYLPGVC